MRAGRDREQALQRDEAEEKGEPEPRPERRPPVAGEHGEHGLVDAEPGRTCEEEVAEGRVVEADGEAAEMVVPLGERALVAREPRREGCRR